MIKIKNCITKKYDQGNDSIETLKSRMDEFVTETYGSSASVDLSSIEIIDKLHAYVDIFYSEIIENNMLVRKFSHIFYITGEEINGKATFTGPDRKTALKLLEDAKYRTINAGELELMKIIAPNISSIGEIQMSLTPVMEILRELIDKNRMILVSSKTSDAKRLKYFNQISDLNIFKYEYKYDACIIEPGEEFSNEASNGIENLLSFVISHKIIYMSEISSVKPYIRTAYSYYSICEIAGNLMEISVEHLLSEYIKLYGKDPDPLKFKNYIGSLIDSKVFIKINDKIKGNEKIFEKVIKI
ncbi:hypothetical protein [Ferroplasma sp.]|uniref:hypothetical protein n=1 Tax=Ferroplasma sp. TaxID=2591003 RepID=UPI00307E4F53